MKLTIRNVLLSFSFASALFTVPITHAYSINISKTVTDQLSKAVEQNPQFTRVFHRLAPYLPAEVQHQIATLDLYLIIKEFLNPNNNQPLRVFFEQAIDFIQKNREFVKTTLKPGLDDKTKEQVINNLLRQLNAHKNGTSLKWIALSFYPLSYKYFPDKRHPFIEEHLDQLKAQLSRRIELNKKV